VFAAAQCRVLAEPQTLANCVEVQVRSLEVKVRSGADVLPEKPANVAYRQSQSTDTSRQEFQVSAFGPVLGNMDAQNLHVSTECSGKRLLLQATVVRSANYQGSVQKYAPWRPEIAFVVTAGHGAEMTIIWRMVLTTGKDVIRGDLPGGPESRFPIVQKMMLR
jgi:hypothetical protein